jgi:cytochrome c peroxidase
MVRTGAWVLLAILLAGPLLGPAATPPPLPRDTLPAETDLAHVPRGFAARPAAPADNLVTPAKVRLGRRLFFDPVLSADRTVACASCHVPDRGFAGADARAVGVGGRAGKRNAPTLLNVAYGTSFFWDGRAASLEEQALLPIADPLEMASSADEAVRRLRADPSYVADFRTAFGDDGEVTAQNLARALASFQRSLVTGDSPVDRFRHGEITALSEDAKQGLWLFEGRGGCWKCHSGHNFTDGRFHNTGVSWGAEPGDTGRFAVTRQDQDRGAFKTPTLRNVARTAPYMHDGSMATLEEVVRYYGKGGNPNPGLDPALKPLDLSEREVKQLAAFLRALSGEAGGPERTRAERGE